MSTHTPGPWRRELVTSGQWEVFGAAGGIVCRVAKYSRGNAASSDARLISAAPDLLAALKQAVDTIRTWHSIHDANDDAWDIYRQHAPEMKAINAAIAKAEAPAYRETTDGADHSVLPRGTESTG